MSYFYRDGASKSGLFCAANYMLEKLRVDNEVDVFLGVRYVSISRPNFVANLVSHAIHIPYDIHLDQFD